MVGYYAARAEPSTSSGVLSHVFCQTRRGIGHGWRTGDSVFSWADQGAWKCRTREDEDINGRKFRIGFEPLFVDFTKEGAVYIVFLMFKWFALGIVSGEINLSRVLTELKKVTRRQKAYRGISKR